MAGWSTNIFNKTKEKQCRGWYTSEYGISAQAIFGDEVISSELNNGYSDKYTVSVKTLREFLMSDPANRWGLKKNIFGSWDFTQPFDPKEALDMISDMSDDEQIIISENDND